MYSTTYHPEPKSNVLPSSRPAGFCAVLFTSSPIWDGGGGWKRVWVCLLPRHVCVDGLVDNAEVEQRLERE